MVGAFLRGGLFVVVVQAFSRGVFVVGAFSRGVFVVGTFSRGVSVDVEAHFI